MKGFVRTLATGALSAMMALYAIGCGDRDVDKAKEMLKKGKYEAASNALNDSKSRSAERYYLQGVVELKKGMEEITKEPLDVIFKRKRNLEEELGPKFDQLEKKVDGFFELAIQENGRYKEKVAQAYIDAGYVIKDGKSLQQKTDISSPESTLRTIIYAISVKDFDLWGSCLTEDSKEKELHEDAIKILKSRKNLLEGTKRIVIFRIYRGDDYSNIFYLRTSDRSNFGGTSIDEKHMQKKKDRWLLSGSP